MLGASAFSHLKTATADYREGLVSDERPLSLNPLLGATDPSVRDVGALLYRRLLRLNDRATPVADLATGFSVSQDGLTYHLPLSGGQRWSDGRPLTAADVIATVEWVQSPGFGDPTTSAPWRDVHARAEGDGVTFDLAGPRASFPALLTQLPILPVGSLTPAALRALPRTAALPMATSGAYRVVSATPTRVSLFPNAHAAVAPHLNQVEIDLFGTFADASAAFRAGTVDGVLATDPLQRAELVAAGGTAHDMASFRFVDLLFNERTSSLSDPAVRQAIAVTVDRAALVAGPLRGMGVAQSGAIPEGVAWAAPKEQPAVGDPRAAGSALSGAGWGLAPGGLRVRGTVPLQLRLAVADIIPLPDLADGIAAQLGAIGISVQVTTMPTASLRQLLVGGGGYDLAVADWDTGPDPDVSSFWRSTAVPPAGFNVSGGPVDPFLDQALDRLATLSDPAARIAAASAVSSQLADDLPAVFLETPEVSLVVRPGVTVTVPPVGSSAARFNDFTSWRRG
ncbi:MAG TPA: ABC transporter substrate-binding protein [Candidatus Dormibacteraeota bacterium]